MGDNLVLRFEYKGKDTDVVVADVDKLNLLDLINDYWEAANKQHNPNPKFPHFTYLHKMKHCPLNTDVHLLQLFNDIPRRDLIHMWVAETTKPSAVVQAAISIRPKLSQLQPSTVEPSSKSSTNLPTPNEDTLVEPSHQLYVSPRRSLRLMADVVVINPDGTPIDSVVTGSIHHSLQTQTYDVGTQNEPPSPNAINDMVLDNLDYWKDIEIEPFEGDGGSVGGRGKAKIRGSGRGRGAGRSAGTVGRGAGRSAGRSGRAGRGVGMEGRAGMPVGDVEMTPTQSVTQEMGSSSNFQTQSHLFKKRVPKTTAKRKGIWVAPIENVPKRRGVGRALTVSLRNDSEVDLGEDDCSYDPSITTGSESDETTSLEDESEHLEDEAVDFGNEITPAIHDDYDAFEGPLWQDDCDDFENYIQRLYNNGEFYKDEGFGNIVLKPWLLFCDKQHCKDVIRDFYIQSGFSVVVERAGHMQYTVRCSDSRCQWRLHSSRLVDGVTWAIKSIEPSEHTCLGIETDNSMVNAHWAAKVLIEDIRANNDIPGKALNELLWERYKVQMKKSTLYRAKKAALHEIHGGYDTSYSFLPAYCEVIKETNPLSTAHCVWNPIDHVERPLCFSSIFISFKACIDGVVAGCRGLIGIDGTFLKGNYGGVLLSAIALDGNNEMFPLAWAIVSGEDEQTWRFFISHLKRVLQGSERGDNWCIISDRHKAIDKACTDLWPEVDRRFCAKHLSVNWKNVFSGPKMWQLFWLAAGAYSDFTFKKAMTQIEKHKPAARIWLENLGEQSRWSKHKFNPAFKCDINKTNFVESFNATLGTDRCRPVLTLLENVRRVTMVRLATRRELCEQWGRSDVCPNIVKRVQVLCNESRTCRASLSSKGEYEIGDGKSQLHVSLNNHTCKCNQWQLTGIPCRHGMRAILHASLDPMKFIHEWYSVQRYKMAYGAGIKPIPDKEQWPATEVPAIEPPVLKRRVGRPVKNRKRGEEEQRKGKRSKTYRCGRCGEFGHNVNSCQNGPTRKQKEASQSRGKQVAQPSTQTCTQASTQASKKGKGSKKK